MSSSLTVDPRANGGDAQPFIARAICIELNGHELACLASHVELAPDVSTTDVTTFCGAKTFPGTVTWHFRVTLYQSFDAGGTDEILCALLAAYDAAGTHPSYLVKPYSDRPVGPSNPSFAGTLIPTEYPLIMADAGEASTIELDWVCDGPPTRTPPCGTARAAAPAPAPAAA